MEGSGDARGDPALGEAGEQSGLEDRLLDRNRRGGSGEPYLREREKLHYIMGRDSYMERLAGE